MKNRLSNISPLALSGAQVKAFETGVPSAHVVRLPNADHLIFRSNEGRCAEPDEVVYRHFEVAERPCGSCASKPLLPPIVGGRGFSLSREF